MAKAPPNRAACQLSFDTLQASCCSCCGEGTLSDAMLQLGQKATVGHPTRSCYAHVLASHGQNGVHHLNIVAGCSAVPMAFPMGMPVIGVMGDKGSAFSTRTMDGSATQVLPGLPLFMHPCTRVGMHLRLSAGAAGRLSAARLLHVVCLRSGGTRAKLMYINAVLAPSS